MGPTTQSRIFMGVIALIAIIVVWSWVSSSQRKSAEHAAYRVIVERAIADSKPRFGIRQGTATTRWTDAELRAHEVVLESTAVALTQTPPKDAVEAATLAAGAMRKQIATIEYFRLNVASQREAVGSSDPRWAQLKALHEPAAMDMDKALGLFGSLDYADVIQSSNFGTFE